MSVLMISAMGCLCVWRVEVCNAEIFLDTVMVISVKVCMMVPCLYPFILLSMTFSIFKVTETSSSYPHAQITSFS